MNAMEEKIGSELADFARMEISHEKDGEASSESIMAEMDAMEQKIEDELAEFEAIYSAMEKAMGPDESGEDGELSEEEVKQGVLNGTIPSGAADSAATSHAFQPKDPYINTGKKSSKIFQMPNGKTTPATAQGLLHHKVREPARTIDVVPAVCTQSLISMSKFADADYFAIFDKDEVNIYDANNT